MHTAQLPRPRLQRGHHPGPHPRPGLGTRCSGTACRVLPRTSGPARSRCWTWRSRVRTAREVITAGVQARGRGRRRRRDRAGLRRDGRPVPATSPTQVGVPVVDGVAAATRTVESLVALGLATSTRSEYAAPPAQAVRRAACDGFTVVQRRRGPCGDGPDDLPTMRNGPNRGSERRCPQPQDTRCSSRRWPSSRPGSSQQAILDELRRAILSGEVAARHPGPGRRGRRIVRGQPDPDPRVASRR